MKGARLIGFLATRVRGRVEGLLILSLRSMVLYLVECLVRFGCYPCQKRRRRRTGFSGPAIA